MALKGYTQKTRQVELPNGESVTVRGFSAADILTLLSDNQGSLEGLLGSADPSSLMSNTPMLVANSSLDMLAQAICLAIDEPDAIEEAKSLPFGVQVEIVDAMAELTLEVSGGVEKFIGIVQTMAARLNLKTVPEPQPNS